MAAAEETAVGIAELGKKRDLAVEQRRLRLDLAPPVLGNGGAVAELEWMRRRVEPDVDLVDRQDDAKRQ